MAFTLDESVRALLFHIIKFLGILRLGFLKKVKIEETNENIQNDLQIITPLMENESRGVGK